MKKYAAAIATVLSLGLLAMAAYAKGSASFGATKQTGGSTGDSMIVAADTSAAIQIPREAINWYFATSCDSSAYILVQVSPDGTRWFAIDVDTTSSRTAEATANIGNAVGLYAGWSVRVIMDNITAAGAPFGRATFFWNKGVE